MEKKLKKLEKKEHRYRMKDTNNKLGEKMSVEEKQKIEVKYISIKDLKASEYNPRKLSTEEEAHIRNSLTRFGFVDPIIVNQHPKRKNIIVGGHQRIKVWGAMGNDTVPAVFVDIDKAKERELNIRLNKNTGGWDWTLLQEFFKKDELMSWGFSEDDLYGRFKKKTKGDDDAPALPANPKTKQGDRYQLGPHILLCGDSTKSDDVRRLIADGLADMIFTDPPYNINYKGTGKNTKRTIENDNMDAQDFRAFLLSAFQRMAEASKPGAALYCCYASRTHREFEDSINAAGYEVRNQIIWVKTVAGMGWGDYRWKHEPMFYAVRPGQKKTFFAGRHEWTAWDEMPNDQELLEFVKKMIKQEEDGKSTVWRFSRESNYVHPTQKPVALVTRALLNSCSTHGIVLDLFGGSGSTLIAAEKNERQARLMEMDKGFCDVIVQRYVNFCKENSREWSVDLNGQDITKQYKGEE